MARDTQQANRVVADVGGTNTRIALFDPTRGGLSGLRTYVNRDYPSLEAVMSGWLDQLGQDRPGYCCVAAAAPPADDRVTMVNMDWSFSCREMAAQFGFERCHWLNDFQANAHALPHLRPGDTVPISEGQPGTSDRLAVMGPGTGLGGACLEFVQGIPVASDSEPGHMGLAPATELELQILQRLLPRQGEVHAEFLVSGPGLVRLYQVIAEIRGDQPLDLSPAQVAEKGLTGMDRHCRQALDSFCSLLGSACGDFVLARGAYGGLYLAGGIVPTMAEFLQHSSFLQRFRRKGAMAEHLERVPVHLITLPHPGLLGAAHAPLPTRVGDPQVG